MVPYEFDADRFSRWIAYVLRHNPTRYGLQPDRHGYVDLETFLQIANRRYPSMGLEALKAFIASEGAARFEIASGQLRARYGHSIAAEPVGPPAVPPDQLYHGIEESRRDAVLREGLQPADRRMLHLSDTREEALSVAGRKSSRPVILAVQAKAAHEAGVAFYREGRIHLVSGLPARYIKDLTPLSPIW